MKFGLIFGSTQDAIAPGEFGRLLEDRGFESLFIPDHTHMPAVNAKRLPCEFSHSMDAFVVLSAIAEATRGLQIGTAVALVTERDPIVTAKEVASLDVLSGGRMNFGVGPGWIEQEMRNHGTDPGTRWRVMRERVEAMKEIWTRDIAAYHGKFVDFADVTSWPKPVQRPHPPILVAGNGPRVAERVVAYGDEWIPMPRYGLLDDIREFKRTARKPGSDQPIPVTVFDGELNDVAAYEAAGVDRLLFSVRSAGPAATTKTVDRIARALGRRLG